MRSAVSHGVTMLELLVCVAIIAIVAAVGVPSLRQWMIAQRVASIGTEVLTDFQLTRSEAISRNTEVRMYFKVGSGFTCYTAATAVDSGSASCDCRLGAGNACNGTSNTEIKTFSVPGTSGVTMSLTSGSFLQYKPNAQIGTSNTLLNVTVSDGGTNRLNVQASPLVRRPTACLPPGSTLNGFKPC